MTRYLDRQTVFEALITKKPPKNLKLSIVIPCFDEKDILFSLSSLSKCKPPGCDVEVIIVINHSSNTLDKIKTQNQETYYKINDWLSKIKLTWLQFYPLLIEDLPPKHAGVGLARKIGMDEAVFRFEKSKNRDGVVICFDADSKVKPNYLDAIYQHFFIEKPKSIAATIHFEHPLSGFEFPPEIYEAIILYELHLRYFENIKKWTGFPYAFQTIGSSMAVRNRPYQKQGGMNKRKAGEDFYFLNKFTSDKNFNEIKSTKVIPSPRISHRVPFGTGKAVGQITSSKSILLSTYNPKSFVELKAFFSDINSIYKYKEAKDLFPNYTHAFLQFLEIQKYEEKIAEIKNNTASFPQFKKRFFAWFNSFLIMKYVHFRRDLDLENLPVFQAANWLLLESNHTETQFSSTKELLKAYRKLDLSKK